MAIAVCTQCENSWTLQKDPDEYVDGPRCTECNSRQVQTVDEPNPQQAQTPAGQDVYRSGGDDRRQQQAQEPQQGPQGPQVADEAQEAHQPQQQAQPPARQPQQAQGQGGNLPAQQGRGQMAQQGMQAGETLMQIAEGDKYDRIEAAAGGLFQFARLARQREAQAQQRAQQTSADQIQSADQYPPCPECGSRLKHLPEPPAEFDCPACGEPLEV